MPYSKGRAGLLIAMALSLVGIAVPWPSQNLYVFFPIMGVGLFYLRKYSHATIFLVIGLILGYAGLNTYQIAFEQCQLATALSLGTATLSYCYLAAYPWMWFWIALPWVAQVSDTYWQGRKSASSREPSANKTEAKVTVHPVPQQVVKVADHVAPELRVAQKTTSETKEFKICASCKAQLPPTTRSCAYCGADLSKRTSPEMLAYSPNILVRRGAVQYWDSSPTALRKKKQRSPAKKRR